MGRGDRQMGGEGERDRGHGKEEGWRMEAGRRGQRERDT